MNWREIAYLQKGTVRQRAAHDTLVDLDILARLRPFDPALVSTVCVDLDVPGSDLDVICEMRDESEFRATVENGYGARRDFRMWQRDDGAVVAQFETEAFPVEIFGKERPVQDQMAWRHLTAMKRLLNVEPRLRETVRAMKKEGVGTEPAFAKLLDLDGDPYEAMLSLETATKEELADVCGRAMKNVTQRAGA